MKRFSDGDLSLTVIIIRRMELSITGVASRNSRKAMLRNTKLLSQIKSSFNELSLPKQGDWCLMVTFVEKPCSFLREVKNKDEIYQVEVGYGEDFTYKIEDDDVLLRALFDAIERAVKSYLEFSSDDLVGVNEWLLESKERLALV